MNCPETRFACVVEHDHRHDWIISWMEYTCIYRYICKPSEIQRLHVRTFFSLHTHVNQLERNVKSLCMISLVHNFSCLTSNDERDLSSSNLSYVWIFMMIRPTTHVPSFTRFIMLLFVFFSFAPLFDEKNPSRRLRDEYIKFVHSTTKIKMKNFQMVGCVCGFFFIYLQTRWWFYLDGLSKWRPWL